MMVLVETNFILEIALKQEEAASARAILRLAQQGRAQLAVPAFVIGEALYAMTGKNVERRQLLQSLNRQLGQLQRSHHRRKLTEAGTSVAQALAQVEREDMDRLEQTLRKITSVAQVAALEGAVLNKASVYGQRYGLKSPDAIVYSSVISHLEATHPAQALFITRDGHFDDSGIRRQLSRLNCALVDGFAEGLQEVRNRIQ